MTRPNRVAPDGTLHAVAVRGGLMGNRGRIHDPATGRLTGRRQTTPAWIACALVFKGRRREVWGSSYTEIFFLDEVTALAAGHRPCFECRRKEATAFAQAMGRGLGSPVPRAPAIDRLIAPNRPGVGSLPRPVECPTDLPDGTVVRSGETFLARRDGRWLAWGHGGYVAAEPSGPLLLVTPGATMAALRAGYRPGWHASA